MPAEKNYEHQITRFLENNGIYALGTEQQNMTVPPVGYYNKRWGGGKYVKSGLPDYQIVVQGHCIEVEVKASNGVESALQRQKIQQINNAGGCAFFLYPKDFNAFTWLIYSVKRGYKPTLKLWESEQKRGALNA